MEWALLLVFMLFPRHSLDPRSQHLVCDDTLGTCLFIWYHLRASWTMAHLGLTRLIGKSRRCRSYLTVITSISLHLSVTWKQHKSRCWGHHGPYSPLYLLPIAQWSRSLITKIFDTGLKHCFILTKYLARCVGWLRPRGAFRARCKTQLAR